LLKHQDAFSCCDITIGDCVVAGG